MGECSMSVLLQVIHLYFMTALCLGPFLSFTVLLKFRSALLQHKTRRL